MLISKIRTHITIKISKTFFLCTQFVKLIYFKRLQHVDIFYHLYVLLSVCCRILFVLVTLLNTTLSEKLNNYNCRLTHPVSCGRTLNAHWQRWLNNLWKKGCSMLTHNSWHVQMRLLYTQTCICIKQLYKLHIQIHKCLCRWKLDNLIVI